MKRAGGVYLAEVTKGLLAFGQPELSIRINGITDDSRQVDEGFLFCAIPGHTGDGGDYVLQARRRGAVAVLSPRLITGSGLPCLVAPDIRQAVSIAAGRFYGQPSRMLDCVGVTGTNGKTTVCHLTAGIMSAASRKPGVLGTISYRLGTEELPAPTTTPGPVMTQHLLGTMVSRGCDACLMEVSSHALSQARTAGVHWQAAAFTNLTHDHLDYHGTMADYAAAKMKLFSALPPTATAVVNRGNEFGREIIRSLPAGVKSIPYALRPDQEALVSLLSRERHDRGYSLIMDLCGQETEINLPLVGEFNLENALCAASLGVALGVSPAAIAKGLNQATPAPGRLEAVASEPRVFVDYAHTPDALQRALTALRPFCTGRLILVFGCGGDRDRTKRPVMGELAARFADHSWVTSDNPRGEKPAAIAAEILGGMKGAQVELEADRREAIRQAMAAAGPEDMVLVAGKGHEQVQIIGAERIHFDDREMIRELLCSG